MRSAISRPVARLGVAAGVLVGALFLGRAAGAMRAAPPAPEPPSVESFDYAAAMARFTGRLSPRSAEALEKLELDPGDTALVLVVTKQDIATCEDLGRQIRELRRAYGTGRTIAVWGDSAHADVLESFLRSERIARAVVSPIPPSAVLAGGRALWTPAAILATPDGRIVEGVSHTLRSPNVRLQSFADELVSLRGQPARAAGAAP